jgi:uncharacterized membrane protein
MPLPDDIGPLDWIAFASVALGWLSYNVLIDGSRWLPRNLNAHMRQVRRFWMRRMLERDNRMFDASLVGVSVQAIAFFASTTALSLVALLGMLGAIENVRTLSNRLSFTIPTSAGLLAMKLLVLVAVLVYAFFKFTWALRQYSYACALIGAAPMPSAPRYRLAVYADHCADMLTFAVTSFNAGSRAYYFGLAVVAWIFHPIACIAATAFVLAILANRQFNSPTFRAVIADLEELERKS